MGRLEDPEDRSAMGVPQSRACKLSASGGSHIPPVYGARMRANQSAPDSPPQRGSRRQRAAQPARQLQTPARGSRQAE